MRRAACFGWLALTLAGRFLYAQLLPGGDIVGSDFYGRPWNLVDNAEPIAQLEGNLLEWHINKGKPVLHDWDLCIFVQPTAGDHYSRNVFGSVNPTNNGYAAGTVELEVVTLGNALNTNPVAKFESFFGSLFKVGAKVEADGAWVQDWGHEPSNPKTELHPLHSLRQVQGDETSLFAARDASGRFSWDPGTHHFSFPLSYFRSYLEVAPPASSQPGSASVITEESVLDSTTNERSGYWAGVGGFPDEPKYYISLAFGEPRPVDRASNGGGTVNAGQGHYHPFYLGKITVAPYGSVLQNAASMSVKPCSQTGLDPSVCPAASNVLAVSIDPSLLHGSWAYSAWRLSKGSPEQCLTEADSDTQDLYGSTANGAHFTRYYSPAVGFENRRWLLVARAGSKSQAHVPPRVGQGPETVSYLYAEAIYEIPASKLTVDLVCGGSFTVEDPFADLGIGAGYQYACESCEHTLIATLTPIPGLLPVPGSLRWTVTPVRDAQGNPVTAPNQPVDLTALNGPWTWEGLTLTIDSSDPNRLNFSTVELQTQVTVTASAQTNVGESLSDSSLVPRYGACHLTGGRSLAEAIARAESAFFRLGERGLRLPTIPTDPKEIGDVFGKGILRGGKGGVPWPKAQSVAVLPEPEHILPRLTGEPQRALEALYKMTAGTKLTKPERNALVRLAIFGSRIKWSAEPPQGAFDPLASVLEHPGKHP